MKKKELIDKLRLLDIDFNMKRGPADLRKTLKKHLEKVHPIHKVLESTPVSELKCIGVKIPGLKINYCINQVNLRSKVACFFFKHYPKAPLTTLHKYMNNEVPINEMKQMDQNDPIFDILTPDLKFLIGIFLKSH